jgi:hypothetical protein
MYIALVDHLVVVPSSAAQPLMTECSFCFLTLAINIALLTELTRRTTRL